MAAATAAAVDTGTDAAIVQVDIGGGEPIELPDFRPALPLRSGHVQTAMMPLAGGRPFRERGDARRLIVEYRDGTGDSTDAYHCPGEGDAADRPVLVLFHGLGGTADSNYVTRTAADVRDGGFDVITPNFRGAGTSGPLARQLHHPGRKEDVKAFLRQLVEQYPEFDGRELVVAGFSLGGHVVLKYLADEHETDGPVVAGLTISAPLSLDATSRQLSKAGNLAFCAYILKKMKKEYGRENADVTPAERKLIAAARTVWQFDDTFTSPRLGFEGAAAFYEEMSAVDELERVDVPTVMIHAEDDPFVPHGHYEDAVFNRAECLSRVLVPHGGHIAFFETLGGRRWLDETVVTLLRSRFWCGASDCGDDDPAQT